jgi:hypothetical protein
MLERKRQARQYNLVPGEEDVELGEGVAVHEAQETGVTKSLEDEVDQWDENNWEVDEPTATEDSGNVSKASEDSLDVEEPVLSETPKSNE